MATQKDSSPQSGGIQKFIFASIGVSLLGLLFGFFIAAVLFQVDTSVSDQKTGNLTEQPTAEAGHGTAEKVVSEEPNSETDEVVVGPLSLVKLEPIVTNLSDTADVWVRLEGSMLFDSKSEESSELLAAKLSQHVLAYLRTLKLTDLQGNGAVNAIAQDLDEITVTVSNGQAHGMLISGLVFE